MATTDPVTRTEFTAAMEKVDDRLGRVENGLSQVKDHTLALCTRLTRIEADVGEIKAILLERRNGDAP